MIFWTLLMSLALGAEPCSATLPPVQGSTVSVAWITPVREGVLRGGAWLEVVPTAHLREWLGDHPDADVGRTLQLLGMRRRDTPPSRLYKITVFEAPVEALCRPIRGAASLSVGGLPVCDGARRGSSCGYTADKADDSRGLDVFRVRWRDAAARGFCVLPLDRFLAEGRR
ncbi:MAG: hypothetical protein JXX28_14550 [Deltaproteobacteria bacterium]|nr:hypothetical protein [Deltaproteobacteria bacterium]